MMRLCITPEHPVAAGHVVNGKPCWPAAAYVAQMIDACLMDLEHRNWILQDFSIMRPLYIDQKTYLQIKDDIDNKIIIQRIDKNQNAQDVPLEEYAYAFRSSIAATIPTYLSIEKIQKKHSHRISVEDFEKWQKESNIVYGELYQRQYEIWLDDTKTSILGLVNIDNCSQPQQSSSFHIHPSIIDTLFQQLGFLARTKREAIMPWFVKKIRFSGAVNGPLFVQTNLDSMNKNVRGSSRLISLQGEVLLELEGILLRGITSISRKNKEEFECRRILWRKSNSAPELLQDSSNISIVELEDTIDVQNLAQKLKEVGDTLIKESRSKKHNICVVGRKAQQVYRDERPDPIQAALWAWFLVAKKEFCRLNINLIDVDIFDWKIMHKFTGHSGYAYRKGQFFQPVMLPVQEIIQDSFSIENCLITGGLGALGFIAANVVANLGARHLWLVSRNASEQSVDREALSTLRSKTDVHIIACDVVDIESSLPEGISLDFIIHTAGVVEDSLIVTTTKERIERVLYPKVMGVSCIHKLAERHGHPKVLLFSSIASTSGRPGQSVYAAANAFMDAYAARCRADGLLWYSIQWGLWNIGVGAPIVDMIKNDEYQFLTSEQGAFALQYVLTKLPPDTYQIIAASNKETKRRSTDITLYNETINMKIYNDKGNEKDMKRILPIIASVLRLEQVDPMDSPIDLGIDSIMAVEITSLLSKQGIDMDPGVFFEVSSIGDLEKYIKDINNKNIVIKENKMETSTEIIHSDKNSISTTEKPLVTKTFNKRLNLLSHEINQNLNSTRLLRPTLPSSLNDLTDTRPLGKVINRLSKDDRILVANGDYFYEPVIQNMDRSRVHYNQQWHLNMASYSYLGLIGHPFIEQAAIDAIDCFGTGAPGVRLLAGTTTLHRKLEATIADFLQDEDAIVFSSGYIANVATISALLGPEDVVIGDMFNHASIVDGCRLSGAKMERYRHNDMNDLENILSQYIDKTRTRLVVSDAVFSMDGDIANLPDLIQLCQQFDALLMIDEAHSLGVIGKTGRGICEYFNIDPRCIDVKMGTLSKTIPSTGGYVCGSRDFIFALKNNARGWMFSAAISPPQAAAAMAAFEVIKQSPSLVSQLQERIHFYRKLVKEANFVTLGSETPIVPIMTSTDMEAIKYARHSQRRGLFVQPITYPTVMRNAPRLRTIVTLDHSDDDLREAISILKGASFESE